MLESLFPGRIDLGMGRAPGADRLTAYALNPSNQFNEKDFVEQLMDLQAYLRDEKVPDTIHERVMAIPQAPNVPELWILSSSGQSGIFAAHLGMAFSFAQFHQRQRRAPAGRAAVPRAVSTQPGAGRAAGQRSRVSRSAPIPRRRPRSCARPWTGSSSASTRANSALFPTAEEVRRHEFTSEDRAHLAHNRHRVVSGTPAQVREAIPPTRGRIRSRRNNGRHHHCRFPGPPALLRAAGRSLRPAPPQRPARRPRPSHAG